MQAISAGATFFGGLTYIGNAPNMMLRAIASHRGVRMPGFIGFMLLASALLLPVFVLLSVVFFRWRTPLLGGRAAAMRGTPVALVSPCSYAVQRQQGGHLRRIDRQPPMTERRGADPGVARRSARK